MSLREVFKNLTSQEVWSKLLLILKPEKSFYFTAIIYSIGVSFLSLGIPISVQALVNTVTFGVLLQPLVILSIVLLALLIFSGALNALQTYIIEIFQRHFYTRTTVDITKKLLLGEFKDLERRNSIKLVNRYFDVMTVQKSATTLLTGGIDVVLQTFVGLILLAFYHPYFLVFNFILLLLLWLTWSVFWRRALETAVKESKAKYETASWLEEIAKSNLFFKTEMRKQYAMNRSDANIMDYLQNRKNHFKFTFLQNISLLSIYALMSSLVLALGGYLVIIGELTLGQLVAAELVVTVILSNFAKSGKYLIPFYDLYAAVDKLSIFYDLKLEDDIDKKKIESKSLELFNLDFDDVVVSQHGFNFQFNYCFESSKNYFIHTQFYSTKLIFLELTQKLIDPKKGIIKLGEVNFAEIAGSSVRDFIYVIDMPVIIQGTIEENLTFGKKGITSSQINRALEVVELGHLYTTFEDGLQTNIVSSGFPLWSSQLIRLEIARAILYQPKVLILTETFDQIERKRRMKILQYLSSLPTTVLMFSSRESDDYEMDKYLFVSNKNITDYSSKKEFIEDLNKGL